jgi:hypothetical protein
VQVLRGHGADVDYRSSARGTPLDCARKACLDAQVEKAQVSLDEIITLLELHGAVDSSPSEPRRIGKLRTV